MMQGGLILAICAFAGGLILTTVPSVEVWRRTELFAHLLAFASLLVVLRSRFVPRIPWFLLTTWVGFGLAVAFSALFTSESAFDFAQVLRKVWVIPSILFLASYAIYVRSQVGWWSSFLAFAGVAYGLMLASVMQTPDGIYVASQGGYTGRAIRLYVHFLDGSVPLLGTAVVAASFPMAAVAIAGLLPARSWKWKAIGFAGLVLYCGLALATGTRTGLLTALGASICAIAVGLCRARRFLLLFTLPIGAAICLGSVSLLVSRGAIAPEMLDRFSIDALADSSFTGRTEIWRERQASISKRFWGVGYMNATEQGFRAISSHNTYIEAFYSLGWLAGALYLAFVFSVLFWSARLAVFSPNWESALPLMWLAMMYAAYGLTDAVFVSSLVMHYSAFVCFGACVAELQIALSSRITVRHGIEMRPVSALNRR